MPDRLGGAGLQHRPASGRAPRRQGEGQIGFIIGERLDFGTAKEINAPYTRLLKVTPFSKDEMQHFAELLRDRNLFVHHGTAIAVLCRSRRPP